MTKPKLAKKLVNIPVGKSLSHLELLDLELDSNKSIPNQNNVEPQPGSSQPSKSTRKRKRKIQEPLTIQHLDNHLFYDFVKPINKQIDAFVVVINCKNEYFPRIIKCFDENGATVSIMVKSLYNWKWALKKKNFFIHGIE